MGLDYTTTTEIEFVTTEGDEYSFDIETLGLDAGTYPVIFIGIKRVKDGQTKFWSLPEVGKLKHLRDEESKMLKDFCDWVRKSNPRFVGYNNVGFDIPFMKRRCFRYGIEFPRLSMNTDLCTILERTFGLKYHKRLSDWCMEGGYTRPSQFFGNDVPVLYLEGNMDEIKKHNQDDLDVVLFLNKRLKEVRLI